VDDNIYEFKPCRSCANLDESKLASLSSMTNAEYGHARKRLANEIGIPVKYLDAERADRVRDADQSSGMRPYWKVVSWHEPVEVGALADQLEARLKRHVVMSDEAALTVALWVMFSWVHDAAVHSPILLVSSPEAECGKTTLLSLVSLLVPKGFVVVEISSPVLYRMIEKWHPTLIVDEADSIFKNNGELRSVINSGWTRGAGVPRCHPETHEPEFFETFGPKAIGLKGRAIPDTTLSRSIIIEMQRKLPNEKAEDFGHQDDEHLSYLRQLLARFADDNKERLGVSPKMPEGFGNRLAANWRLMLAIAELCGPRMAARAREAAATLSRRSDDASLGVELLRDIRDIRDSSSLDRIASTDLVGRLGEMADRPWAEMPYSSKPITQPQLAKLLKAYDVRPKPIRFGERLARGYEFAWFDSAFRYIPSEHPQNRSSRMSR
jgi:putative DNA primase/helicase